MQLKCCQDIQKKNLVDLPSSQETYKHVMKLHNNKSSDSNEIPPEFFKIIVKGEMFI